MYIKKIIVAIALIGVLVMAGFAYYVYSSVFTPNTAFNNEEAHLYIPTGASFSQVVEEVTPLLDNVESFVAVAERKQYNSNIKAGHFILKKGMNNNDIINSIRSGNTPINIKFNNQERLENLAGHLAQQMEPDSTAFIEALKDPVFLKEKGFSLETALAMYIPNTYEIYWNTTAEDFRDKMYKQSEFFWNNTRKMQAKKLNMTPQEVISLAAIVQKETAKVDERPTVAGLYLNRLRKGMLLQADPTVIYAKKRNENNFDQVIKRVLYKDLELDSKYNTYKYTGVPPGPITMPDVSSIDAVLADKRHDYYYMVADVTNFGYHKFAKTLSQHNQNKVAYVNWINKNGVNR
ncbi:hypothetical protein SCB49_00997 [unidentified eubacterium SCB49]|nr:hypothetical protein SCB49_00997 [unidentified eubacterium SCB49]